MAFIRTSRGARGQRPQGPPALNRQSPQARGLLLHYNGLPGVPDSVGGVQFAPLSTDPQVKGSPDGLGIYGATAASGWYSTTLPSRLQRTNDLTLTASFYYRGAASSNAEVWGIAYNATAWGSPYVAGMEPNRASGPGYYINGTAVYDGTTPLGAGFHTLVLTITSGGTASLYVDGVLEPASVLGGAAVSYGASSAVISGEPVGNGRYTDSVLLDGRIYAGVWSAALAWHHHEPQTRWDLYAVPSTRVYFDQGAVGGGSFNPAWASRSSVIYGGSTL